MAVVYTDTPSLPTPYTFWRNQEQAFYAFHVLNAWEEKVEVEGTTNAVIKIVTCDMFDFELDQNTLNKEMQPGACVKHGPPNVACCTFFRFLCGGIRRCAQLTVYLILGVQGTVC